MEAVLQKADADPTSLILGESFDELVNLPDTVAALAKNRGHDQVVVILDQRLELLGHPSLRGTDLCRSLQITQDHTITHQITSYYLRPPQTTSDHLRSPQIASDHCAGPSGRSTSSRAWSSSCLRTTSARPTWKPCMSALTGSPGKG
eukprot:7376621-Prymnesium_polylepis.1